MNNTFPRWTFFFIFILVIGFVFQNVTNFWYFLAFFPAFSIQAPWMFLTSIFLHTDISHLFFNVIALFIFGIYLERMVGRRTFIIIFFTSGILGNVGYLLTATDPLTPAIGASGAVYGIIGTLAALAPFMIIYVYGLLPMPMVVAAIIYGFLDFGGLFVSSRIAHGAHLAGMFVGIAFGLFLRNRAKLH